MNEEYIEKYAVIQCSHCGLIQARIVVGKVFGYEGSFKSVNCHKCKKRIDLSKAKILFRSETAEIASGWIRGYKSQKIRETIT